MYDIKSDSPQGLVHLVPHLAGGGVAVGGVDVSASLPLDAGQLVGLTGGVEEEAHAAGHLGVGEADAAVGGSGGGGCGSGEDEPEDEDEGLQTDQDQQVGQVEGEHLGRRGGSSQHLHGFGRDVGSYHCVCKKEIRKLRQKYVTRTIMSQFVQSSVGYKIRKFANSCYESLHAMNNLIG